MLSLGLFAKSAYSPLVATVAKDGRFAKSLYEPDVATVARVGLFRILVTPVVAVQSEGTCAAGIVGVFIRSL